MIDYRKYYKQYYGIEFNSDYIIHHLDLNRENNDISNLLLLPKKLHIEYHQCLESLKRTDDDQNKKTTVMCDFKIVSNYLNQNSYNFNALKNMVEILEECSKWKDYKMYLDGNVSNIHSILLSKDGDC